MKSIATGALFFAFGFCLGNFSRPMTAHAQSGLRSAHIVEVNMNLSDRDYTFNGTPLSLSCTTGGSTPKCYVLVQGN
jgi:hypothetical protein